MKVIGAMIVEYKIDLFCCITRQLAQGNIEPPNVLAGVDVRKVNVSQVELGLATGIILVNSGDSFRFFDAETHMILRRVPSGRDSTRQRRMAKSRQPNFWVSNRHRTTPPRANRARD